MSVRRHPWIPNFPIILARNPCVGQKIATESGFFKYYKTVKTMIKWLGAFEKVCIYFVILFEVEFRAMIAMQRYVLRERLLIYT